MSLRMVGIALALPLTIVAVAPVAAEDQVNATAMDPIYQSPPGWSVPRTEWGDPDLTGKWPIDNLSGTPAQRPAPLGTKAWLTDEEYAAAQKAADEQLKLYNMEVKANRMGMGHWTERGQPMRQTSLIMEPADGRVPPPTAAGLEGSKNMKSSWSEDTFIWVTDFSPYDRCIARGLPGAMTPGAYNSGIEVWQSPGYAVIRLEMIHDARIIPLAGKGPPPAPVKSWMGYSVGHWEGDTLVIETTNFLPGQPIGGSGVNGRSIPSSDQMKMVEKLTLTNPDHIHYEAWVSDPVTLTAPFKYDFPWTRNSDYVQYEYACIEGNEQTRGYIEGTSPFLAAKREARAEQRDAGEIMHTEEGITLSVHK
ncbi:hypothetical protein GRI89_05405 [Altererythrobacter salegens]|uniref:Secreted protein n=1 Tax=Croceibacterium salegens TaxID=1737568 RepID=A0A6I4SXD3_9SPHN|nr:hypothetical protein [Croceibacterium salegens]MXO58972.1 hypothetical protein [Croceibacterium salegens]